MSKAVGWAVIVGIVLLLGTHPGSLAGLLQHFFVVLQHAGDELSSFVNSL
jgi:hypothetical protein